MKKSILFFLFGLFTVIGFSQCNPNAGNDTTACGTNYTLSATPVSLPAIGSWSTNAGGVIFADTLDPNTTVTIPAFTTDSVIYDFYWTVTDSTIPCSQTDTVTITFYQQPHANAGGNYWSGLYGPNSEIKTDTACGYDYYLWPQTVTGTGTWHTTDQINTWFLNPNSSYTNNPYDTAHTAILTYNTNPNYYDFVWVENNSYGCTDQDTLRLFFAPIPTGSFTVTEPWCIGYPSTIIAHTSNQIQNDDWGLIHFNWGFDGGIVDTTGGVPITGMDEDTIYVHWENGDSLHIVSLLTSNIFGCYSPINFDTIIEPPHIIPNYNIVDATCGLANGIITLYTNHYQLTFTWDSTFICPTDTIQQGLLGDQTYTVLVHGESFSPDAPQGITCTDTISIYLPDTGYTTALFDTIINDGVAPYSVTITNLSINGSNYEWYVYDQNNQLVWNGTDEFPTFTINQEGCYHIVLVSTSPDNCRDTMEWGDFCVYHTDIETENTSGITIFPNPSSGTIFIESPQTAIQRISITDVMGKIVKQIDVQNNHLQIDLKNEPEGIYFVTVRTKTNSFIQKIVMER